MEPRTNFEKLVVKYADGKKICNCGQAYRDSKGSCDGGCSANTISAKEYIADRVVEEFDKYEAFLNELWETGRNFSCDTLNKIYHFCEKNDKDLVTNTGDEESTVKQISQLRLTVDTIGGTPEADKLRKDLDRRLTECHCLLTGKTPKVDPLDEQL